MKNEPQQKTRTDPYERKDDEELKINERRVGLISAQVGLRGENGAECELYYQLVETVRCPDDIIFRDSGGRAGKTCYSVAIQEYSGGVCGDSSFAYDITDDKEKALGLFRTLVDETVTPSTLGYVLEDIL